VFDVGKFGLGIAHTLDKKSSTTKRRVLDHEKYSFKVLISLLIPPSSPPPSPELISNDVIDARHVRYNIVRSSSTNTFHL